MLLKNVPLSKNIGTHLSAIRTSLENVRRASSTAADIAATSYAHNAGSRPLQYETVGRILEKAANIWPDRPWIISRSQNVSMTFSQVIEKADRLAAGLLQAGLGRGDRLGLCGPGSSRWLLIMLAAARAGIVTVAINPAYQCRELEFCVNKAELTALAVHAEGPRGFRGALATLAPGLASCTPGSLASQRLPTLRTLLLLDDADMKGAFSYKNIYDMGNPQSAQSIGRSQSSINPDSPYVMLFTSGTTGQPRAAQLSHFGYVNNSWEIGYRNEWADKYHKVCLQAPFFHAFGLLLVTGSLQHGASLVLPAGPYSAENIIQSIVQDKCTVLTGTPTMYVDLVSKQKQLGLSLETPELAVTAGAWCSTQLFTQMREHLGVRATKSVYGMTEASVVFQSTTGEDITKANEMVGQLMSHMEVKVVDNNGNCVPKGTPGELWVRSYCNMMGYWKDEEKTANMVNADSWLKTGDQFILEDDNYARISGRLKEVIIRGGENIFPKEIEDFLNTHPDILETQVFGVKDDRLGEEICASVRVKEGSDFGYNIMKKYCQGTIAHFKVPRHLKIVEKFPITASGKIQKFKLKEMVESGQI